MLAFALFFVSGGILIFAGIILAHQADVIASLSKLGRFFVGSVFLACATSLPELFTDISAIVFLAPNLAVGDLFGSSMANMLILSIIDLIPPRGRVFKNAAFDHGLAACLAISLSAFAAIFVLMPSELSLLGLSFGSILLFSIYLTGNFLLFKHAKAQFITPELSKVDKKNSIKKAIIKFSLAALITAVIAPIFAWSAKEIAVLTGLGNTFIGTWLVGISTSLPELASSITAIRMGAFDLAVGNLFGSNALNMALFLPLDLVHKGALFSDLDQSHALSSSFSIILMSIGLFAIMYRAKFRIAIIQPDSFLMLIIYIFAIFSLYLHLA
jgi:cation:H+ antiporter